MTEELLKALQTIKKECKKQANCGVCPLHDYDDNCGVRNSPPEKWKLEKREVYF